LSKIIRSTTLVEKKIEPIENLDENLELENEEIEFDFFTEEDKEEEIELERKKMQKILQNEREEAQVIIDKKIKEAEKKVILAQNEADEIMEQTYEKSKQILEQSRTEGFEEGYNKGYQEAYDMSKQESDVLIEEANQIKKAYLESQREFADNIESEIVMLIIDTIQSLTYKSIESDKEIVIERIKEALKPLRQADSAVVKVCEEDFEMAEFAKDRLLAGASMVENLTIKIDKSLNVGDCIVESERGIIDLSLTRQLEEIKSIMKDVLKSGDSDESTEV
jgi:flagellar assembly protein FliH